jgi:hypothetical protein
MSPVIETRTTHTHTCRTREEMEGRGWELLDMKTDECEFYEERCEELQKEVDMLRKRWKEYNKSNIINVVDGNKLVRK